MNPKLFTILGVLVASVTLHAQAQEITGNAQAGSTKASMCIGCHGIAGYQASFPEVYKVPKISGQSHRYIVNALIAYQKGDRRHPTMRAVAQSMTEQDIADVAAFYAAQTRPASEKAHREPSAEVAALLQKGACISCHGEGFTKPIDPSYPKVAGQHPDYLYAALKSYQRDTEKGYVGRSNGVMAGIAKQFSHKELKQLANYMGSLQGDLQTVPEKAFR